MHSSHKYIANQSLKNLLKHKYDIIRSIFDKSNFGEDKMFRE